MRGAACPSCSGRGINENEPLGCSTCYGTGDDRSEDLRCDNPDNCPYPVCIADGHCESSGVLIRDKIAKTIWLAEYRRATGRERSVTWHDVADRDQDRYRFIADVVLSIFTPTFTKP